MRIRELIGFRDIVNCFLASLAMTLIVCGIPYIAAGGPMPSVSASAASFMHGSASAKKMEPYSDPVASLSTNPAVTGVSTASVWPKAYQVLPGDYLSKISKSMYGSADDWTVIYWANKSNIRYADVISAGLNLTIPALPSRIPAPPTVTSPPAPVPANPISHGVTVSLQTKAGTSQQGDGTYGHPYYCGDGDGDGWDIPCSKLDGQTPAAPANTKTASASAPGTSGGYTVSSSFQACVIRAESGGNAQIWNASGHWGLYQFSYSTWVAHGGVPSDFGHAGASVQTQIFYNTVAQDGKSDWAPYDGC
jgi:Transglycosylase-like domain